MQDSIKAIFTIPLQGLTKNLIRYCVKSFCLSCVLIKDLDDCLIKDSFQQNIVAKNKDRIRSTRKNEEDPRSLSALAISCLELV